MTSSSITALFFATIALAIVPSPSVFAVVARTISSGFIYGLMMSVGIMIGDLIFMILALSGLSTIAETADGLFVFVKYLGGAYLVGNIVNSFQTKNRSNLTKASKISIILCDKWLINYLDRSESYSIFIYTCRKNLPL